MAPDYEQTFQDRSEYQGERGPQYRTPSGAPRDLSVGERAGLLRRAGIDPNSVPSVTDPNEYGVRVQ